MDIYQLFEDFSDGVVVFSHQGHPVYFNAYARHICQAIAHDGQVKGVVPKALWRVCQRISEQNQEAIALEELDRCNGEFVLGETNRLRIRSHPVQFEDIEQPCLLLIFEDRQQVLQSAADADAHHYSLTPREKEVWALRRVGHSYGDIANQLFITVDTVKKHLKNIRMKRDNLQNSNVSLDE